MNYYEELAVAQDASQEQIHQAYRLLVRLLHPDNQSDPKLKSAAERQMIRLNEVLATLTDPRKRRKYDESLCNKLVVLETAPPPPARALYRHGPWVLACCILVGIGAWYMRSNESGAPAADRSPAPPPPSLSVRPAPATAIASAPPAAESRTLAQNLLPKKPPVRSRPSPPSEPLTRSDKTAPAEPLHPLPEPGEPVESLPPQTVPERPAKPEPASVPVAPPSFAGRWLYAPSAHDPRTPGMYPPEFIEFSLSEDKGVLSGEYWARYRIPDKPVSPEVQFRVKGAPQNGNTATLKWVSDDGAGGQLKIVLRDANSMEVTWWTTAFGGQTALTSGAAVLLRQLPR
jgi:hypothetical protein